MTTKAVTFRDYEKYSAVYEEKIVVTAAQQLEDFLNNSFWGQVTHISYSVTYDGLNSIGVPKYRNHILLVYNV